MKEIEAYTIESIAGSTNHLTDWHKSLAALAYARARNIPAAEALKIIVAKRLRWLDWLTVTQRKWQSNTRNANKANFHDSLALREQYVRCH